MKTSDKGAGTRIAYSIFLSFLTGGIGMIIAFFLDGILSRIVGMIQWGILNGLAGLLIVRKNPFCSWYIWIPCDLMILAGGIFQNGFWDSTRVKGSMLIVLLSITGAIMGLVFQNEKASQKKLYEK